MTEARALPNAVLVYLHTCSSITATVCSAVIANGNASAGLSSHSTVGESSIRYYHVISVGVICFLIGAITSFVILIHCSPRVTPAAASFHRHHVEHRKLPPAADAVAVATTEKRRCDVTVTSRGVGGATLQTVIGSAASNVNCDDKLPTGRTNSFRAGSDVDDVFCRAAALSGGNDSSQSAALLHLRQYYRRHYTGGVADTNYCRN